MDSLLKKNEKVILGLDMGVASLGWSLLKITLDDFIPEEEFADDTQRHQIVDYKIIDLGVRSFDKGENKDKKSLASIRGKARRQRATARRKKERKEKIYKLFKRYNFIPKKISRKDFLNDYFQNKVDTNQACSGWALRVKALDNLVTDKELVKIIYHIILHRGFHFTSKTESSADEDAGEVKKGLKATKTLLEETESRTIAEAFSHKKKKRNSPDKYENSVERIHLKAELELIFEKQLEFGNTKLTDDFMNKACDLLMYQRGYDSEKGLAMVGKCPVYPDDPRSPKHCYTSEYFILLNRINTLSFINADNNKSEDLPLEIKQQIKDIVLSSSGSLTFAQLRKKLPKEYTDNMLFNLCSYNLDIEREKFLTFSVLEDVLHTQIKQGKKKAYELTLIDFYNSVTGETDELSSEALNNIKLFVAGKIKKAEKKQAEKKNADKKKDSPIEVKISYHDIRKLAKLDRHLRFNDLQQADKYPPTKSEDKAKWLAYYEKAKFIELTGFHLLKSILKGQWETIQDDHTTLDNIAQILFVEKEDEPRTEKLNKLPIKLSKEELDKLLTTSFKGTATYGLKAIKALIPYMEQAFNHYDAKKKAIEDEAIPDFENISDEDKNYILPPYSGEFKNNPVVSRIFSQARKLINALTRKYGKDYPIDQIKIEIATEIANGQKKIIKIQKGQNFFKEQKDLAFSLLERHNMPINTHNLLKMRLYLEQEECCVYSGEHISLTSTGKAHLLSFDDCEVDHILPFSRTFNDSQANKVLVSAKSNQEKRGRTPKEWIIESKGGPQAWEEFKNSLESFTKLRYSKRKNLLKESLTKDDTNGFITRNLNDTRYASKAVANYIRSTYDFSKRLDNTDYAINPASKLVLVSGGITSMLRYNWGVHKLREEDDKHHAKDATVIALTGFDHIFVLSNIAKKYEKINHKFKFPEDIFNINNRLHNDLEERLKLVNVSRMPRNKGTGILHKDTIRPYYTNEQGENLAIESTKTHNKQRIFKGKEKAGRVFHVRNGWAEMGTMIRADIFRNKKGKWFVVPVYAIDILRNDVPHKAIATNKPYKDWVDVSDPNSYTFQFSLFKDNLIKFNDTFQYVNFTEGTQANINLLPFHMPSSPEGERFGLANSKNTLEKYNIDILGKITKVKKEKRLNVKPKKE